MKRWGLLILVGLLAGALLFQKITQGGGYVLVALGNTRVEMSFWTGLAVLLVAMAAIMLGWWLLKTLYRLVTGTGTRVAAHSGRTVQKRTARGLVHFIEGNWKQARKQLLKSAKKSDYPLINYLAAARSTYELDNPGEAFDLIHKAETSDPDSGLAVALTQARMLLAGRKYEQCLANLQRAKKLAPHHPVVLDLLQQTYRFLEDWQSLRKLLPELRRYDILSESALRDLEQRLYYALVKQAGDKAQTQSPEAGALILKSEWESIPKNLRRQPDMVVLYVRQLLAINRQAAAESLIRRTLKQNWHDELVDCYGWIAAEDPRQQLLVAEAWLKERPGNATVLLTLGRLCLRNHRWQEARDYFGSSLKLEKRAETYAELARLCAHTGEYEQSSEYYQASLSLAGDTLPPLPMPQPPAATGPRLVNG